jgi:hypothetical protein
MCPFDAFPIVMGPYSPGKPGLVAKRTTEVNCNLAAHTNGRRDSIVNQVLKVLDCGRMVMVVNEIRHECATLSLNNNCVSGVTP